jgi:hypothetical protein
VWVFVDYRKVENNVPAGNWTRAAVNATPAINSTPTSTATLVTDNDKGFWLHGVDGDYSATLTVPLTLTAGVTQFNWCAYATDYPPNVVPHSTSSYTLRGSRPFVVNGTTLTTSQTTFSGTITSFTDATGAPGLFPAALDEKTNGMGCVAGLVENLSSVCITPPSTICTNNTFDIGTASFSAGTEVTIIGNGISQKWSRPVTATGCQKQNFNGGTYTAYRNDCRTNPSYSGDYFSGCAMLFNAAKLCPPPWRIPVAADYLDLLTALGGVPGREDQVFCETKLINLWGAELHGWCSGDGVRMCNVGTSAAYMIGTLSEDTKPNENNNSPVSALRRMSIWTNDMCGSPMPWLDWMYNVDALWLTDGMTVRCVRN